MKKGQGEITIGLLVLIIVGASFFVGPIYKVWQKEKAGQAQLAEATWNRQIAIEEARAEKEAAKLQAEAEVERAKGVAEANQIIGEGLQGNEEYLRYLWIQKLGSNNQDVIYVPTEASIPILEAQRLG